MQEEEDRMLTVMDVCKYLNISRSGLYTLMSQDETFPKGARIIGRSRRWKRPDLDKWVESKQDNIYSS